ncbi:L,D-transpeptidase [Candidatus Margulisiibacteriota bacterium]
MRIITFITVLTVLFSTSLNAYKLKLPQDIYFDLVKKYIFNGPSMNLMPNNHEILIYDKGKLLLPDYSLFPRNTLNNIYKSCLEKIPPELEITDFISIVDISDQKNYLFYKNKILLITSVSTGSKDRYKGDRTMFEAVWRLGEKVEKDLIPLYGPRLIYLEKYLPGSQSFIKTKKAFHGTKEPFNLGNPTSMGCVYHHNDVIKKLYNILPGNTLVITKK